MTWPVFLFYDSSYVNGDVRTIKLCLVCIPQHGQKQSNCFFFCIVYKCLYSLYREEKHLTNRDGGKVFLENTIICL